MDYFYDALTTFLGIKSGSCIECQWKGRKLSDLCSEDERNLTGFE